MNIIEWMVIEKIAENGFAAAHISDGLKLPNFDRDEQEQLCRLYRKWRPKTDKKNKDDIPAWQAYDLTIAGINPDDVKVRQVDMFVEWDTPEEDAAWKDL